MILYKCEELFIPGKNAQIEHTQQDNSLSKYIININKILRYK